MITTARELMRRADEAKRKDCRVARSGPTQGGAVKQTAAACGPIIPTQRKTVTH